MLTYPTQVTFLVLHRLLTSSSRRSDLLRGVSLAKVGARGCKPVLVSIMKLRTTYSNMGERPVRPPYPDTHTLMDFMSSGIELLHISSTFETALRRSLENMFKFDKNT